MTAIGLYLEGILDLQKFIDSVDHAYSLGKPIALIKVGRSSQSQSIAKTHTGALTGSDELHDALFKRLGVARCETCLLYTSPSPRDATLSRMPSSA